MDSGLRDEESAMTHPMFTYDESFTEAVFEYCRDRLRDDAPLDYGSHAPTTLPSLEGLVTASGRDPHEILALWRDHLAPHVVSVDSPGFLAFIPNAPTEYSLLFDMIVACSGLNGTSWLEAAGVVAAENQALDFLAQRAGMPAGTNGAFVSGGSIGNLSALTVARDVGRERRPDLAPHAVRIAISADAHSSIGKALHVIGVEPLLVEPDDHRLTRAALEAAIARDPHPDTIIGVVATAGTTNAGIVDDLEGLGALARERQWWFHVDGAYGGAAMFSSARESFRGLRHADSFIVDPHKWLFAPLDCCALLWRDPATARTVLAQQAGYLDVLHQDDDLDWNPSDFAIMLSRRARGLPFWFSLVTYGTDHYESAVQRGIDLAHFAANLIESSDHLELVREAGLSIVLFRRPGWSDEDYTAWSADLLRRQVAFVTPTKWEGETVARIAFMHPDTTEELVTEILESLR